MLVRIMIRHPVDTSAGPLEWSKARFEIDPRMLAEGGPRLGKWLNETMGKLGGFDFRRGYSREIDGRWVYFPKRRVAGVHCAWVEPCES